MKLELSRQIYEKYSNIEFDENLYSGIRAVSCGRRDGEMGRQADIKLLVAFGNFAKALKNCIKEKP
jgi:hypothetical protein